MREKALLISWGPVPRGREAKALEVFKKVYDYLTKKKEEGKITFNIYFNAQSAELIGFMVIHGKAEHLMEGGDELERLYLQAAAVVDNLSTKVLIGGSEESVTEHLILWSDAQKELGYI